MCEICSASLHDCGPHTRLCAACRRTRWQQKAKYRPEPPIDSAIREAYALQRTGDRLALTRVARQLGWPRWAITRRSAELGCARIKERPWSAVEEALLYRHGHLTCRALQTKLKKAGFVRSQAAVAVKLNRLRIKRNLDGYSASALGRAFGVDTHKVIAWVRRGMLTGERRQTARTAAQGGDTWWIRHVDVKAFAFRYPEEIDLAKVERFWFLDLITDGKICR